MSQRLDRQIKLIYIYIYIYIYTVNYHCNNYDYNYYDDMLDFPWVYGGGFYIRIWDYIGEQDIEQTVYKVNLR